MQSMDETKLWAKDNYAAVLNQAPSQYLVEDYSESFSLTNKYDYSFTIPKISTALKIRRSDTTPGSECSNYVS